MRQQVVQLLIDPLSPFRVPMIAIRLISLRTTVLIRAPNCASGARLMPIQVRASSAHRHFTWPGLLWRLPEHVPVLESRKFQLKFR
jgi:hypothetical protein